MFGRLQIAIMAFAAAGLAACGSVSSLETQARILAEPPCTDIFFPVYFPGRSAELDAAADRVIRNAGRQAQGCRDPKVAVVGLPDPAGPGPDLSRERARRVAAALEASGLPRPTFQASALDDNAPPPTIERRRADVFIRFQH